MTRRASVGRGVRARRASAWRRRALAVNGPARGAGRGARRRQRSHHAGGSTFRGLTAETGCPGSMPSTSIRSERPRRLVAPLLRRRATRLPRLSRRGRPRASTSRVYPARRPRAPGRRAASRRARCLPRRARAPRPTRPRPRRSRRRRDDEDASSARGVAGERASWSGARTEGRRARRPRPPPLPARAPTDAFPRVLPARRPRARAGHASRRERARRDPRACLRHAATSPPTRAKPPRLWRTRSRLANERSAGKPPRETRRRAAGRVRRGGDGERIATAGRPNDAAPSRSRRRRRRALAFVAEAAERSPPKHPRSRGRRCRSSPGE